MKHRLLAFLDSVWGSVAFRLTLNYSVLALSTSLLSLFFVYYQTVGILESQFSRQVAIMAQRMSAHFDQGGLAAVIREINLELADHINTDTEIFLLTDKQGRALAGNIEADPVLARAAKGTIKRTVVLGGRPVQGYLVNQFLPDGSQLIIGEDLRDLREITSLIKTISLAATFVIAMLVLLGAYIFRRTLQRRVEVIRQTAAQIGAGHITWRIPVQRRQDEFALLTHDINSMLDRIEHLMTGVRHVSDAVAHNLRTPLTRILSKLNHIRRNDGSQEDLNRSIDFLVGQIEDLAKVSEKLMQIGELESGTRRAKFELTRLDVLAQDVSELYDAVAEARRITLRCSVAGEVRVLGDRHLLAGAISNLVDNAFKYCAPGACIRLEVKEISGQAIIEVADNGPGIPADKRSRIGERFYRLNRDVPGYGLGLATVIAIAQLHNASFELLDANPGLCVRIQFPHGALRKWELPADPQAAPAGNHLSST